MSGTEQTTTTNETTTDNLVVEPVITDNSNTNKPENVEDAAVNGDVKTGKEGEENHGSISIPEKFLKEDGTPDYERMAKSYLELEPLVNEKAQWSKEKIDLEQKAQLADNYKQQQDVMAKNLGFENYQALEQHQNQLNFNTQMAKYEANEYAKYLNQAENPAETRELLMLYSQQPSPELLAEIESRFTGDVHKKVGENMAGVKQQIQQQNMQQTYETEKESARTYLVDVTEKYGDYFKNEAFTNMFGLAFKELGTKLDAPTLISAMDAYKDSVIKEYESSKQAKAENDKAKSDLSGLNPGGENVNNGQEKNILDMTPEQMQNEFKKYK